ncbi:WD repeat-containing protein 76 [Blattella germanica]|nr:WD repeat-containing protein 76 [Blattella germanica]
MSEENVQLMTRLRKRKHVSYCTSFNSDDSIDSPNYNKNKSSKEVKVNILNQENELSEYEQIRQKNIEERRRLLVELNIEDIKKEFNSIVPQKKKASPKRSKTPPPPRPKSLRLQKKNPEGEPVLEYQNNNESTVDPGIKRKPAGSFPMTSEAGNELDGKEVKVFIDNLKLDNMCTSEPITKFSVELEEFRGSLEKLTLSSENVAKVVPHRVYSMAVHPSNDLLLAAGDKWGNVGLWNVNGKEGKDIMLFNPHIGPVSCINFCSYNPERIYSTSHDGTVVCGDMKKGIFDDVYASDENMPKNHTTWHCQTAANCLMVAHGNGNVALVDNRCKTLQGWFYCHTRSVRTVQLHPLQSEYFITSSAVCEAKIWDSRYMLNKKQSYPICSFTHAKGLTSAFFSPSGKHVLTTCNDDKLRIYDVTEMNGTHKLLAEKVHNTHTGQWLTTFKATWHPQRDDVFIVGSMDRPRCIPIFNSKCQLIHKFTDEDLSSVCSVCVFHPKQQIIFGGNSSGRVHVFM